MSSLVGTVTIYMLIALAAVSCLLLLLLRMRRMDTRFRAVTQMNRQMLLAADQSPAAVAYIKPDGHVTFANKRFLGHIAANYDFIGSNALQNPGPMPSLLREAASKCLETGREWRGSISMDENRAFGAVTPIFSSSGELECLLVMFEAASSQLGGTAAEMVHDSQYSHLTGLPNRQMLINEIQKRIGQSESVDGQLMLLVMDIDHFKDINDSFGLGMGDHVLRRLGLKMQGFQQDGFYAGHIGGDKFAVLGRADNYRKCLSRCRDALNGPFRIGNESLALTGCFGITFFPEDGQDSLVLLRNAETAMYQAKSEGRNRTHFYREELNQRNVAQFNTANQLSQAIAREELTLLYQPMVKLTDGYPEACEVLLRWNNALLGKVNPERFITVAEDTGLIVPIGRWVLRQACQTAASWRGDMATMRVAVNVSSRQFIDGDILDSVRDALNSSGLPAERLELEITEGLLLEDHAETRAVLMELNNMGIRLALDDFGTGYSSLGYLKRFPFSSLKIDRSFVRDIAEEDDASALTLAMIDMAHSLKLEVVAEGVETMAQRRLLTERGCDTGQGFLFARPMPAEEISNWLSRWRNEGSRQRLVESKAKTSRIGA